MKQRLGIVATGHEGHDGFILAPEALESMVEQANSKYIPLNVEHDPRIPPVGRMLAAQLVRLKDGVLAVQGLSEVFEDGDIIPLSDDGREMPSRTEQLDVPHISYDKS